MLWYAGAAIAYLEKSLGRSVYNNKVDDCERDTFCNLRSSSLKKSVIPRG